METYARNLPYELKIKILTNLEYIDVKFITDPYFWSKYWKKYRLENPIIEGQIKFNPEQQYALDLIAKGKNVFIHSPAGTGKSTIIKHFAASVTTGVTSTTGISALNIEGSTLHSFLGIGLGEESLEDLYNKLKDRRIWLNLKLLIIDEISMLQPQLFEKLEKLARKIRKTSKRFGGIQLVVAGDLFQLPPVNIRNDGCSMITDSQVFLECIDDVVELRNIMRQQDYMFQTALNKIRVGNVDSQTRKILKSRVIKLPKSDNIKPTKLFCTKKCVNALNEKELNKLAAKDHIFREYEMKFVFSENVSMPTRNYVSKNFVKNSTTPQKLQICKETQVMLTYNLPSHSLANGSRGVVVDFANNYPIVEFVGGKKILVEPVSFSLFETRPKRVQIGYVKQIPLKIAYALTIHSSQGATLDCVQIDLKETFEYGQAYTALSRVRCLEGLYLKPFDYHVIQAHPKSLTFNAWSTTHF